jgi:hypothetical protein
MTLIKHILCWMLPILLGKSDNNSNTKAKVTPGFELTQCARTFRFCASKLFQKDVWVVQIWLRRRHYFAFIGHPGTQLCRQSGAVGWSSARHVWGLVPDSNSSSDVPFLMFHISSTVDCRQNERTPFWAELEPNANKRHATGF